MFFDERAANAQRMHDGKEPGPPIPVGCGLLRVGEQVTDVGVAAVETGGGARPDHSVELSVCQQIGNGDVGARVLDDDVGWQVETDLLDPTGMLVAASDPGDV